MTFFGSIGRAAGDVAGGAKDLLFGASPDPNAAKLEGRARYERQYGDVAGLGYGADVAKQRMALANQLRAVATGQTAGAGELAAQREGERARSTMRAQALSARGYGGAASGAALGRNLAVQSADSSAAQALAAMQDQERARALQAGVLSGITQDQLAALAAQTGMSQAELVARMGQEQALVARPGLVQLGAGIAGSHLANR